MARSADRILVTHAGALPRSEELSKLIQARAAKAPVDEAALKARLGDEIAAVVRQQIACGIDSINDGELSKSNFLFYVLDRISGITTREVASGAGPPRLDISARDRAEFPEYFASGRGGFAPRRCALSAARASRPISAISARP
jgi:5-methyltetrahydropteroyltriglutamate--homocysteine methyltransferase